jgi:hypothetical protein
MTITGTARATTVTGLARALESQLQNAASLGAVTTRVLLRTGVNLRTPTPHQDGDTAVVEKVRAALADMGYGV